MTKKFDTKSYNIGTKSAYKGDRRKEPMEAPNSSLTSTDCQAHITSSICIDFDSKLSQFVRVHQGLYCIQSSVSTKAEGSPIRICWTKVWFQDEQTWLTGGGRKNSRHYITKILYC